MPLRARLLRMVHRWPSVARPLYRLRYGAIGPYLADTSHIPSWLAEQEALALADVCQSLPPNAVVVEIGSFLGKSAIILAGARKHRGSGKVHCVDPFDASGDTYSVPVYRAMADAEQRSLRQRFDDNISRAGVRDWVQVHEGTAASVASTWTMPIDMLFIDGDQSPEGARVAFDRWIGFLKVGGIIALHNSTERIYAPGHDGMYRVAVERLRPPGYGDIRFVDTTTLARKLT